MKLHQRIRRERTRNTDDWLITYADTITLLLCLFVVILSVKTGSQGLARDQAAPMKQIAVPEDIFAAENTFPMPTFDTGPADRTGSGTLPEPIVAMREPDREAPRPSEQEPYWMAPSILSDVSTSRDMDTPATGAVTLPAIVERLNSQGQAVVAQRGDRIATLQIGSATFFASGAAALSETGKSILRDVAVTLRSGEFVGYRITVEGHTDDTPIRTAQFQSNWELSTARAAAVVRFFLEQGVAAEKLTAAGYADTFPIAPNRNGDGTVIPDNQAKNRRVLIKLEKIDRADQ